MTKIDKRRGDLMPVDPKVLNKEQQATELSNQIAQVLQGIRFGSVEIIIHDSKVVQIERKEKMRFDNKSTLENI